LVEIELLRLHAVVAGHVQGVGFRNFVQETALDLNLTGWVRNRWNGDVEVLAEGDRNALAKLSATLQRGPRSAYVIDVRENFEPATGEFSRFVMRQTE
jgi:acylphosphatase